MNDRQRFKSKFIQKYFNHRFEKIHVEYFQKYFLELPLYKENLFFALEYPFNEFLFYLLEDEDYSIFFAWGKRFTTYHNISKDCIYDIVLIMIIIYKSNDFRRYLEGGFQDDVKEAKEENRILRLLTNELNKRKSQSENKHKLKKITLHFDELEPISIPASLSIVKAIRNLYLRCTNPHQENFHFPKTFKTADIRMFSIAILAYLNEFTDIKAPENTLATNLQCRIIFDLLYDAGSLNHRPVDDMDKEAYIREYLKQAVKASK